MDGDLRTLRCFMPTYGKRGGEESDREEKEDRSMEGGRLGKCENEGKKRAKEKSNEEKNLHNKSSAHKKALLKKEEAFVPKRQSVGFCWLETFTFSVSGQDVHMLNWSGQGSQGKK